MIEVFLNNEKIDLYKDENIQVNDSIQNIKDIGKIFTTFSRQFSVPATKRNNKIFKNFYNFDIIDGFDPREKVRSVITKNGATWRKGFIQIENVKLKNNKPSSYKIFFTGEISELKDIFKEDRLSDLSYLSNFDHSYTQDNVEAGFINYLSIVNGNVTSTFFKNDICYPFISVGSRYAYNNSGQLKKVNENGNFSGSNLNYRDLKPAIRLTRIIEAIEAEYNMTFSNDFFGTDDFTGLYLWLNRTLGQIGAETDIVIELFNNEFDSSFDNLLQVFTNSNPIAFRRYELTYTIIAQGTGSVNYEVINNFNGEELTAGTHEFDNDTFEIFKLLQLASPDSGINSENYVPLLILRSENNAITQLDVQLKIKRREFSGNPQDDTEEETQTSDFLVFNAVNEIRINDLIPKMKVIDFLTSIFKTFNLTARVVDGVIEVKSLDSFYDDGGTQDISSLVDIEDVTVSRVETIKEFNFEFNQSESILIKERNKRVDDEFGNLDFILENEDPTKVIGGINYNIKSEFYKILFEKLTIGDTGQPTNTLFSWYVDEKKEPISNEPIIFYTDRKQANGITFQGSNTTPATYIAGLNAIGNKSINFGSEIDEFTLQLNNNSLFNNFYKNYIERVVSPQARKVSLTAILRD
ncbi:MAG TPA: hypothetical protein VKN64_00565, partial [Halanaerobiales bacterium]|nr:hypothetical protein [Halanaerobiales bacterium]